MAMGSIASLVLSGLVLAGEIILPVLLLLFVIRSAQTYVTPQQKEMQRLLEQAVELLKENNRLLKQGSDNLASKKNS